MSRRQFLPALFSKDPLGETEEAGPRQIVRPSKGAFIFNGSKRARKMDFDTSVTEGFEAVVAVYRSVIVNANKVSGLNIVAKSGDDPIFGEVVSTGNEPLLRVLNRQANPFERARQFRWRAYAQSLLSEKGVFIEIIRNMRGEISKMWLLNPADVEPVTYTVDEVLNGTSGGEIVKWFKIADGKGGHYEIPATYPDGLRRVAWFRWPHPSDPLKSHTPLQAANIQIDIDFATRMALNAFSKSGGGGKLVGMKGRVHEDSKKVLADTLNSPNRGREFRVVDGIEEMNFVDLSANPAEAEYIGSLGYTKDEVLGAFGTPESVAYANASGKTFANADTERENWWISELVDRIALWDEFWDELSDWAEDFETGVVHDLSQVQILRRPAKEERDDIVRRWRARACTYNDVLRVHGEEPWDRPEADTVFLVGSRIIPKDDATADAVHALGYGGGTANAVPESQGGPAEQGAESGGDGGADNDNENDDDPDQARSTSTEDEDKAVSEGAEPDPFRVVSG